MLQFKPPVTHSVCIPAGDAQGFTPLRSTSAYCHISHEQDNGLQESSREGCPCEEGRDGCEKPTSQLHTCLEEKVIEEIRDFLEWGCGRLSGYHQVGCCGFGSRGFEPRDFFLLELRSSRLWGFCRLDLRLLSPSRLPGGSPCRLLAHLRDRLKRGIWISWWSGGCPDESPPLDDASMFGLESWPFYTDLCWFVSSSIG